MAGVQCIGRAAGPNGPAVALGIFFATRTVLCGRWPCARGQSALANALRQLALPRSIRSWTLTTLREKLVRIGAKVVTHAKYAIFQLAGVAVPRRLFAAILRRIGRLRLACASG